MITLEDILKEEDGKFFTRLPEDLDSSTLRDLIKLELQEEIVVNNIKYDPKIAKFCLEKFTPKELETLYYMALGYNNEGITKYEY